MKDLDKVFKDMDRIFKDVDSAFKKVDQDINRVFKQMEKIVEQAEAQVGPLQEPWQKWFAWHPVTIKGKRRWMTSVYRRTRLKFGDPRMFHEWEYGDMFDVLKEAGSGRD